MHYVAPQHRALRGADGSHFHNETLVDPVVGLSWMEWKWTGRELTSIPIRPSAPSKFVSISSCSSFHHDTTTSKNPPSQHDQNHHVGRKVTNTGPAQGKSSHALGLPSLPSSPPSPKPPNPKPQTTKSQHQTQVQTRIFSQVYNPTGLRTGNKILRQRLRGPSVAEYYPRRGPSIKDLKQVYKHYDEQFEMWDDAQEDRLESLQYAKSRGKGAPKKRRSKAEAKRGKPGKKKTTAQAAASGQVAKAEW